jgi:ADP-ribosyl-[dinitrogen reductase] hydrolase
VKAPHVHFDRDRFQGCLLGLAAGDAVGTAVEFKPRGTFAPVVDMTGGGPFRLAAGQWTDDTSMALCLADSLLAVGFNLRDQLERYCRWQDEGYRSSTGRCFDIGVATRRALQNFRQTGQVEAGSTHPQTAGNGCIMRLAPVAMYFAGNEDLAAEHSARSCVTTHRAAECLDAARLLGRILARALRRHHRDTLLTSADGEGLAAPIAAIARREFLARPEDDIRGLGYVVACLEAAIWSFETTDSFEAAVLRAANLGDDADTTAAVCGQIAGAFYGLNGIPSRWRDRLHDAAAIRDLADQLFDAATTGDAYREVVR